MVAFPASVVSLFSVADHTIRAWAGVDAVDGNEGQGDTEGSAEAEVAETHL